MKACVSACHFQILIRSYVQMGQGAVQWEQTLKSCREGEGSAEKLQVLCTDLQKSVRLWLDLRLAQLPVSPTVLSHAIRAVQVCKPCLTLLMPPTSYVAIAHTEIRTDYCSRANGHILQK